MACSKVFAQGSKNRVIDGVIPSLRQNDVDVVLERVNGCQTFPPGPGIPNFLFCSGTRTSGGRCSLGSFADATGVEKSAYSQRPVKVLAMRSITPSVFFPAHNIRSLFLTSSTESSFALAFTANKSEYASRIPSATAILDRERSIKS